MAFDHVNITGGDPSSSGSKTDKAGRIPTNPAAKGICIVLILVRALGAAPIGVRYRLQSQLFVELHSLVV